MRKVIFLDRDGVINNNVLYYTYKVEDFVINNGVVDFLKAVSIKGFEFIVITNQSGISKGIYSKNDVEKVHEFLIEELNKFNISVLEIYYCSHHNEIESCLCRKPNSLLIEKAIARFSIDRMHSYFIGDQQRDVETALAANIMPILIEPNSDLSKIINKII
ncbi:MAG: HAD-IIIA family hydrolase [Bacteroidia bacterium]|nr:HAD-IIIA family hydrolase [Bacteroidia bacterium]